MVNVQIACISVSIEPADPLNNTFECWNVNYLLISTKIGTSSCDRYLQAVEFNSLCFNFSCLLGFNFVRCMVKFVGFNRTAVCWLLLRRRFVGFFPVSLQLLTHFCPLQFCVPSALWFSYSQQSSNYSLLE